MKLIKIGSSPSCDIVINSPYVSSRHADITILDNGEMLIEDKGSSNGTFVGAQKTKLNPGQEVKIHRGDRVILANEMLPWNRIPQQQSYPGYKVINIGSNQRNDIVVPGEAISRYHALLLVDKKGKVYILDNNSTNGTKVNGLKIPSGRKTPIKRGDNIILGGEDVTDRVAEFFPKKTNVVRILAITVGAVCLVALIVGTIWSFFKPQLGSDGVLLVRNIYHYNVELAENPYNLPIKFVSPQYVAQGTGFFIDDEGRIGTNRHVACPWFDEYQTEDAYTNLKIQDELRQGWLKYLEDSIPAQVKSYDDIMELSKTRIGQKILEYGLDGHTPNPVKSLNQVLQRIYNTPITVTGESDNISVAYPNRHYSSFDEFERATIVAESGDKAQDVAILQLNTKQTPKQIIDKGIFDINNIYEKNPGIQKEDLQFSGYPDGIMRTWDDNFKVLNMVPTTYRGKCTRNNDPFKYEIQGNITHGASGSPVYYNGKLYGILWGGYKNGDNIFVAPARQLKKLYDEKVLPYKQQN